LNSKNLALTAVFAALYAVLVILQGISAAATIQLRIADCLIPLAAIFGLPHIIGVTVGCFVGNAYFSASLQYGIFDIVFGPIANLAAASLIFKLRKKPLVGCLLGAFTIGLIVGSYLWLLFGAPENLFGLKLPASLPVWVASIISITGSSLVAVTILGYMLLKVFRNSNIIKPLKSRGLQVYLDE
jgi:uncharacterized membrane protein